MSRKTAAPKAAAPKDKKGKPDAETKPSADGTKSDANAASASSKGGDEGNVGDGGAKEGKPETDAKPEVDAPKDKKRKKNEDVDPLTKSGNDLAFFVASHVSDEPLDGMTDELEGMLTAHRALVRKDHIERHGSELLADAEILVGRGLDEETAANVRELHRFTSVVIRQFKL